MPTVQDIINIGFNYHQDGKLDDAENAYQEALKMDGDNAEIYNLIGVLKLQQGEPHTAIKWIEKAIERQQSAYFYETLFQAYIRVGYFNKIIENEHEILKQFPDNFALLFNIALAYKNLNMLKEAIKYYEKALEINPASYDGWFNLAHLYNVENDAKNALSAMKICKKIKPNDADTDYFLSLAYMRNKDYANGLKYFENRLCRETAFAIQNKTYPNKLTKENLWKGENIKDKTLLVYYEAGFGDFIMFSRFLPLAAEKCKKLIIMPQKQLAPLYRENRNLGIDEIIDSFIPEKDMNFDVHAPLLSLPYIMGLKGDKVFAYPQGYLRPNKTRALYFRKRFFENEKIKIGIKWQGNTYYDQDRVIPTEAFLPLMKVKNTQFYSFQTYEGSKEVEKLEGIIDIAPHLNDFADTAAALFNLDLVICNDTSLAHLAGAMGIPCWVLLPYEVNWRWHSDLSKCDWYDSLRFFRQHSVGDWDSVFEDVLKEMKQD